MKRREFLVRTAGLVGAVAPSLAIAQSAPCPIPALKAEGGSSSSTACTDSPLAQACRSLASGQSMSFPAGIPDPSFGSPDIAWQTAFFHDDVNGFVHLMGKPANADQAWGHQRYTVASSTWKLMGSGMWNNPGHIYGNFTMDYATGDIFQGRGGWDKSGADAYRRIRWWRHASGSWGLAPTARDLVAPSIAMVTHLNGVVWHPNLYGPGDGGLVVDSQFRTMFWRKSTDSVEEWQHSGSTSGGKEGAGVYWPKQDAAYVGGSDGEQLLKITPNGGNRPIVTAVGVPPLRTAGNSHSGSSNFGSLHVHPGNPDKLLILETNGPRVFSTTNGTSWTLVGNHPFTRVPRVVCSLRGGLGCFWAVGREDGGAGFSQLWRPPL